MDYSSSSITPLPYDTYSTDTGYAPMVGQRGSGPDTDYVSGVVTNNTLNGRRYYVLVYNNSGTTLSTGQALMFSTGYFGTRVEKCTQFSSICGYVPPVISGSASNTIAAASYFWMIKEGFTTVRATAVAVTEGNLIEASATAGSVKASAGTGNLDVLGGTFIATDADGGLVRAYANCQW